ncbi:hypothetical protein BVX97_04530 [bacterium E08(2017)]|nr:hypothetical protein BVX97_04530 [bacterium E08(2017)]
MIKRKSISLSFCLLIAIGIVSGVVANTPSWWHDRNVIQSGGPTNDYAPLVQGQLKWMATNAYDEMEANIYGGAGAAVSSTLAPWYILNNDYSPVPVGQVKYVSSLFYDRLIALGVVSNYPWTETVTDDRDFAPANIGQMKNLFNFEIPVIPNGAPTVDAGTNQTIILNAALAWTPADIATIAWYDASEISTITEIAGAVSQVDDKSGNAQHIAQTTNNWQPTTGTRTLSGLNVLDHDGSDAMFDLDFSIPPSGDISCFMVAAIDEITNRHTSVFATYQPVEPRGDFQLDAYVDSSFMGKIDVSSLGEGPTLSDGPFHGPSIYETVIDYNTRSNITAYIDGELRTPDNAICTGKHATNAILRLFQNRINTNRRIDGHWGEFIMCQDVTSEMRQKVEGYLAHKWGLTDNLPADHPYKSAAPTSSATANLDGTVEDPNNDELLTMWSHVGGPAPVTFANAYSVDTTADFSKVGTYVLRLVASDGEYKVSDEVTITVATNRAPFVDAGPDQSVILIGNGASAQPTAGADIYLDAGLDDGLNTTWEDSLSVWNLTLDTANGVAHVANPGSGLPGITGAYDFPGGVSGAGGASGASFNGGWDLQPVSIEMWFKPDSTADDGQANGQILFETGGSSGLGIFYNDGAIQVGADTTEVISSFDVSSVANEFIQVVLTYDVTGTDEFILYVNGVLADTGNRSDSDWSGSDAAALAAKGASNVGGRGSGDQNTDSFEGQIAIFRAYRDQILTPAEVMANYESIAVGGDRSAVVNLKGLVSDDGLPSTPGAVTSVWSIVSGPPNAVIQDVNSLETAVTFDQLGTYVLQLEAGDGTLLGTDQLKVTVKAGRGIDSDGDGMGDDWEFAHGFDPYNSSDAGLDADMDGLTNLEESDAGTNPLKSDSDNDIIPDIIEIHRGTDPLNVASVPDASWYVDASVAVSGDGLSASGAFKTISEATVTASEYDIIYVAPGQYAEAGDGNINTLGKTIVLIAEAGPEHTIVDMTLYGLRGFELKSGENRSTVLYGFTINDCVTIEKGGGIYINNASPTVKNCVISNCNAIDGGGIAITGSSKPMIENCVIRNNTANRDGGGVWFGGMSAPHIGQTTIRNNFASGMGAGICGE